MLGDLDAFQYKRRDCSQTAKQLMVAEVIDATSACYRVGHETQLQLSQDYARLFGVPPARDVGRLKEAAGGRIKAGWDAAIRRTHGILPHSF